MRLVLAAAPALLAVLLLAASTASASTLAGASADPDDPSACAWVDPGPDEGIATCVRPLDGDCLVGYHRETIWGGYSVCLVPAP